MLRFVLLLLLLMTLLSLSSSLRDSMSWSAVQWCDVLWDRGYAVVIYCCILLSIRRARLLMNDGVPWMVMGDHFGCHHRVAVCIHYGGQFLI